jgi:hypothetical protein
MVMRMPLRVRLAMGLQGGLIMKAQYVARLAHNGRTHKIRKGWSYSNISNARTGCGRKGPFGIEHMHSGTEIAVTCLSCIKGA